jgi:hypothetical protein
MMDRALGCFKLSRTECFFIGVAVLVGLLPGSGRSEDDPAQSSLRIGKNVRIYASSITQTETFITRHPGNPSILFCSANTINLSSGFVSEGIYVSTNGGTTWRGSDTCNGAPISFHGGDPGIAIDKNGIFVLIRLGTFPVGLFSHFSTDNGLTWSSQRTIATGDLDRATLVSDGQPSSGSYGRSYATWVQFAPPYPVMVSYTDNGGTSWSVPVAINNPPERCRGGEAVIGPGGAIYATWAGVTAVSPFTEDHAGFAKSTNGGSTWTVTEVAYDMNGIAGVLAEKSNIRVNGLPRLDVDLTGGSRNGWIYIVSTEKNLAPAGTDPDVILHRSTDAGLTWSAGVRVNQDGLNNGKLQYFPVVHVDHTGGVNVLYYDDRATTSDSASVFLSRSTDGGFSWSDFEIATHHFRPVPIGGLGQGYQGDNIGMNSIGDTLWPVWMDNSSGIYQVWTCPVDISTLTSVDQELLPVSFGLDQNFPNPFNPTTEIGYQTLETGHVTLKIYDMLGREVTTLVNQIQGPGRHRVSWNAGRVASGVSSKGGYASGVYYYRIVSGGATLTRKMVLIR